MTIVEQNSIKKQSYKEAVLYIENAKDYLSKAKKEGKYYTNEKYVQTACAVAYLGLIKAVECLFLLKGLERPEHDANIYYYRKGLAKIDKKLLKTLNASYNILHLGGYYRGEVVADVIKIGFEEAMIIINKIKPSLT